MRSAAPYARQICAARNPPKILNKVQFRTLTVAPNAPELESVSLAADKLWSLDENRLVYGRDYELDVQAFRRRDDADVACRPLFKRVENTVFDRPTLKTFAALLDNYTSFTGEAEVETAEERMEHTAFLNVTLRPLSIPSMRQGALPSM